MKTINKLSVMIGALALAGSLAYGQQYTLSSTTTTAAVTQTTTQIPLTSVTGITVPGQPTSTSEIGTPGGTANFTMLYSEREAMQVLAVNTTTLVVTVARGYQGTTPNAHASGIKVWFGPPELFGNQYYGNNIGPSGSCTLASTRVSPVVVPITGKVYQCINSNWAEITTDGYYFVDPNKCTSAVATTAYDTGYPIQTSVATGESEYVIQTSTASGTVEVTCPLNVPERLATARGVVLTDAQLLYGVQTTALGSIAAATVKSITFPTGGNATPLGTVAAAGGTITATPGTLLKATTTAGLCYNEKLAFGTAINATVDNTSYAVDQVFTVAGAGSTKTVVAVCGMLVHYSILQ